METRDFTQVIHRLKVVEKLLNSDISEEARIRLETGKQYCNWFLNKPPKSNSLWYKE